MVADGKSHGSGSGSSRLYVVEARYNFSQPKAFGRQMFDNRWQSVSFVEHPEIGVHVGAWDWTPHAKQHGFLDYEAAMVLAHWFMANTGSGCIETRLVQIELEYSFSTKESGVGPPMNLDASRRATTFVERTTVSG